jgi:hypothetical protein
LGKGRNVRNDIFTRWEIAIRVLWKGRSAGAVPSVRLVPRSPPLDPPWWLMAVLTPLADDATVQEHVDNMPVIFIQHANNIPNREPVVDE